MADLRMFLGKQPNGGGLIIRVTHVVAIAAITDLSIASGEGVVIRLKGDGRHAVLGRLGFEDERSLAETGVGRICVRIATC